MQLETLTTLFAQSGLSKQQLADEMHVRTTTVIAWFRSHRPVQPHEKYHVTLANILGVSVPFLQAAIIEQTGRPLNRSIKLAKGKKVVLAEPNLRSLITALGISEHQIANMLDIHALTLFTWMRADGRAKQPSYRMFKALLNLLNIDQATLITAISNQTQRPYTVINTETNVSRMTLKQLRQQTQDKPLTQKRVATIMKTLPITVHNWETGWNRPQPHYHADLAALFHISESELIQVLDNTFAVGKSAAERVGRKFPRSPGQVRGRPRKVPAKDGIAV